MIFGARLLLLLLAAASSSPAAGWNIEQLMQELGQVRGAKGRFVERKYLGILTAPLESSGTLTYVAPSRLEKHTLTPRAESLLLEGDQLTMVTKGVGKAPDRRRTVLLQDYPAISIFVESIRSTLAGDLVLLRRFYEIALDGDERRWRLVLKPRDAKMQELITEIRIGGSRSWIDSIEFFESGGDRSVMAVTRVAP